MEQKRFTEDEIRNDPKVAHEIASGVANGQIAMNDVMEAPPLNPNGGGPRSYFGDAKAGDVTADDILREVGDPARLEMDERARTNAAVAQSARDAAQARRDRAMTLPGRTAPEGMTQVAPNVYAGRTVHTGETAGGIVNYTDKTAPNYYKTIAGMKTHVDAEGRLVADAVQPKDGTDGLLAKDGPAAKSRAMMAGSDSAASKARAEREDAYRTAFNRSKLDVANAFQLAWEKYSGGDGKVQYGDMTETKSTFDTKSGTIGRENVVRNGNDVFRVGAVEGDALDNINRHREQLGLGKRDRVTRIYAVGKVQDDGSFANDPGFVTTYVDANGKTRNRYFTMADAARFHLGALKDAGEKDADDYVARAYGDPLKWNDSAEKKDRDRKVLAENTAIAGGLMKVYDEIDGKMPKNVMEVAQKITTASGAGKDPLTGETNPEEYQRAYEQNLAKLKANAKGLSDDGAVQDAAEVKRAILAQVQELTTGKPTLVKINEEAARRMAQLQAASVGAKAEEAMTARAVRNGADEIAEKGAVDYFSPPSYNGAGEGGGSAAESPAASSVAPAATAAEPAKTISPIPKEERKAKAGVASAAAPGTVANPENDEEKFLADHQYLLRKNNDLTVDSAKAYVDGKNSHDVARDVGLLVAKDMGYKHYGFIPKNRREEFEDRVMAVVQRVYDEAGDPTADIDVFGNNSVGFGNWYLPENADGKTVERFLGGDAEKVDAGRATDGIDPYAKAAFYDEKSKLRRATERYGKAKAVKAEAKADDAALARAERLSAAYDERNARLQRQADDQAAAMRDIQDRRDAARDNETLDWKNAFRR